MLISSALLLSNRSHGYSFNEYAGVSNSHYVTTFIVPSALSFCPEISVGRYGWNILPQINVCNLDSVNADIIFNYCSYYPPNVVSTIAGYTAQGNTAYKYVITFYPKMITLTSAERKETVAHEMGHAFGLGHTQTENNNISIMRQYGFVGSYNPLYDDILGINILYN